MHLSLDDEVLLLREQVNYLLEQAAGPAPSAPAGPVVWAELDADQAADLWQDLTAWTDWLRDRYQLQERLPHCWYAHGALTEELTALRSAWLAAFTDPEARPDDPARWHDTLDRTLQRIQEWDRNGCRDGTHRHAQALRDDTDQIHRERTIIADLARRETGG